MKVRFFFSIALLMMLTFDILMKLLLLRLRLPRNTLRPLRLRPQHRLPRRALRGVRLRGHRVPALGLPLRLSSPGL